MEALQLAGKIATQHRGTVIGTIGDEVMCIFDVPEDALIAANHIHSQVRKNALMQKHQLAMRIGINSGTVVSMSGSIYGDTVNIAARLAQLAKANQSLVSSATKAVIGADLRTQLRPLGKMSLQGKAGMTEVHDLLEPDTGEEITEVVTANEVVTRSFLMTTRYLNQQKRFNPMLVRFLFGRSMECDQIIDHPTISREHAEFLYRNGQFILRDFSTNGSVLVQGSSIKQLHRSSVELKGNGKIYLGRTLHQHRYCIEFTCLSSR